LDFAFFCAKLKSINKEVECEEKEAQEGRRIRLKGF